MSAIRRGAVPLVAIAIIVVAVGYLSIFGLGGPAKSGTAVDGYGLQRSGPISTFPAVWSPYASCPGISRQGNTTTANNLSIVTYPDSWNTTSIVTLAQVYESIVDSSQFTNVTSGHGWVAYSWGFDQGGSSNNPPYSDDITGYFILTNASSPDGYVIAYYDIQTGGVAIAYQASATVYCPPSVSATTSSSTDTSSSHG